LSFLRAAEQNLEYEWLGPSPADSPTIIFLHEGLGCVQLWRDFPRQLVERTGLGALVYSRSGYGNSDPVTLPRSTRFMHDEAIVVLPQIIEQLQIRDAVLFGHSDGGSISLIYAGAVKRRIRALVLEAPHVFVEEFGLRSIRKAQADYQQTDLRAKLQRYHGNNVDCAFRGWNDVWLSPDFLNWNIEEFLPGIEVPILVMQGDEDQYGTWQQVERIKRGCSGPVETVLLDNCGHSPHREQQQVTLDLTVAFLKDLLRW
jgi:pimeloyl-ACP methyl ester carboxylesterase